MYKAEVVKLNLKLIYNILEGFRKLGDVWKCRNGVLKLLVSYNHCFSWYAIANFGHGGRGDWVLLQEATYGKFLIKSEFNKLNN